MSCHLLNTRAGSLFADFIVRFGTSLDQPGGVLPKLLDGLHCECDVLHGYANSVWVISEMK